ncbi:hypothetical protein H1R17_09940 [Flavobacterium sp. xlx-214]|uniref:hypothetical protein n=1 Tax=unclassified Flavobacterium TaxID=196869 RepID=UPI0013D5F695|nr:MULTISPECIES: hypothetical protein [unclassified Flavobacterium]MBA5793441.1 hypothetical protein [Flavobacterium sp. xlx-221]QMI82787.1 hypothetical protein H1R17_09940 [Flavobacterium sp. xlx-214]
MKKLIIFFVFGSLVFTSCKKEENKIHEPMANPPIENSTEVVNTNTAEDVQVQSIPTFKYAEADKFVKEYNTFITNYKVATANKDDKALKELGPKLNDFQKRGVELAKRIPAEEAVAFQDFLNKIEQEIK